MQVEDGKERDNEPVKEDAKKEDKKTDERNGTEEKFATVSVKPYTDKKSKKDAKKWRATFPYLTQDKNGNWKWSSLTRILKTTGRDKGRSERIKKQAEAEADEIRKQLNEEAELKRTGHRKGETVAEYVSSYIDGRALSVERSTAAEYRRLLDKVIGPKLGGIELDELTTDTVEKWVGEISKTLAPVTVRKALILLRSAMRQAVKRNRLSKNPAEDVDAPKLDRSKPNSLDERGRAKVVRFIAIDPSAPVNIGIALALYLGLREGEICGLRWADVDLNGRTLRIEHTIGHEGSKWYVKEPKTGESRRELYIPDVLMGPLRERRAQVSEQALAAGIGRDGLLQLFVTGGVDGRFMQPHYLSTRWKKIADTLELVGTEGRRPTFHDLRHTFATSAITHGVDVKTVSSVMGHANAAMTLNTYASADPDAKRRGIEANARAIAAEAESHANDGEVLDLGITGTDGR